MERREFLKAGAVLGLASASGTVPPLTWAPTDLVLRRATVFDGTGSPGQEVDVAISGDRIQAVGHIAQTGAEEIDLAGQALTPGFIDIHTHADLPLLANPRAENRVLQGITLEVGGQCGGSPGPWSEGTFQATRERYREAYGVEVDRIRDILAGRPAEDGKIGLRPITTVIEYIGPDGDIHRYIGFEAGGINAVKAGRLYPSNQVILAADARLAIMDMIEQLNNWAQDRIETISQILKDIP